MEDQKIRKSVQFSEKDKDFSNSVHSWLAQYDEEDDFLCDNRSKLLPDITVEQ